MPAHDPGFATWHDRAAAQGHEHVAKGYRGEGAIEKGGQQRCGGGKQAGKLARAECALPQMASEDGRNKIINVASAPMGLALFVIAPSARNSVRPTLKRSPLIADAAMIPP